MNPIVRISLYFVCFAIAMIGLSSIDFNCLLKKNRVWQAQVLYIILSMAIGYLMAQFLMDIRWEPIYW